MIKLIVIAGSDVGSEFTFTSETVIIGRSVQCDVMLHDATLGRRHCEIRQDGETFVLVDLASVNGTYLNDQKERISSWVLRDGDEINLGKSRLRVEIPSQKLAGSNSPSPQISEIQESSLPSPIKTDEKLTETDFQSLARKTDLQDKAVPPDEFTFAATPPVALQPHLSLHVTAGNDIGKVFEFPPGATRFTVGREAKAADCIVNDQRVSRVHFAIELTPSGFVLIDAGSRNGTFLKGQTERLQRLPLHGGEELRLGETHLQVAITMPSETLVVLPTEEPSWRIRLHVTAGKDIGQILEPPPGTLRFTVGRGQTADFTLDDRLVSNVHFAIELTPSGFVLIDAGSRNGTFLKGQTERLQRLPLHGGEELRLGGTHVQIEITAPVEGTLVAPLPIRLLPTQQVPKSDAQETTSSVAEQKPPTLTPDRLGQLPRSYVAVTASLLAMLCCSIFVWFGKPTLFSSAALSVGHAQWDEACSTCHTPWHMQPLSASCGKTDCHANTLQVSTQTSDRCESCHTEHRGRNFAIRGDATRCWRCHESSFQGRPLWRYYRQVYNVTQEATATSYRLTLPADEKGMATWLNSTPRRETGLIFAHAAHAQVSQQKDCLLCHQPLPGTVMNALGAVSAFPSHEECIDCHREVGDRDPQIARKNASAQCRTCHARDDGQITRAQHTSAFVRFSHDNHRKTNCESCHFTIGEERSSRPVQRSTLYPLPMEACVSCHQQERVTTSCVACHRTHHYIAPVSPTSTAKSSAVSLSGILFALLGVPIGVATYLYFRSRK